MKPTFDSRGDLFPAQGADSGQRPPPPLLFERAMAAVALTGARKAAIEGWLDTPVGGKMLDDTVRLPLKAGAVAQGIDVTVSSREPVS